MQEEIVDQYLLEKCSSIVEAELNGINSVWNGLKAVRDGMAGEECERRICIYS